MKKDKYDECFISGLQLVILLFFAIMFSLDPDKLLLLRILSYLLYITTGIAIADFIDELEKLKENKK